MLSLVCGNKCCDSVWAVQPVSGRRTGSWKSMPPSWGSRFALCTLDVGCDWPDICSIFIEVLSSDRNLATMIFISASLFLCQVGQVGQIRISNHKNLNDSLSQQQSHALSALDLSKTAHHEHWHEKPVFWVMVFRLVVLFKKIVPKKIFIIKIKIRGNKNN